MIASNTALIVGLREAIKMVEEYDASGFEMQGGFVVFSEQPWMTRPLTMPKPSSPSLPFGSHTQNRGNR